MLTLIKIMHKLLMVGFCVVAAVAVLLVAAAEYFERLEEDYARRKLEKH